MSSAQHNIIASQDDAHNATQSSLFTGFFMAIYTPGERERERERTSVVFLQHSVVLACSLRDSAVRFGNATSVRQTVPYWCARWWSIRSRPRCSFIYIGVILPLVGGRGCAVEEQGRICRVRRAVTKRGASETCPPRPVCSCNFKQLCVLH